MVCRLAGGEGVSRRRRSGARALLDRHPAAQRHRRAHDGPRVEQHDPRHPHPSRPPRRALHHVAAGHRPRRHRHAGRGRTRTAQAEENASRFRPRKIRREGVGMAPRKRRHHPRAAPPARRVVRLGSHRVHDGSRLLEARPARLRRALQPRLHLPRQAHGELVPGHANRALRRGGQHEAGQRHDVSRALPAR